MTRYIDRSALLNHLRKERDDYFREHFFQDPATGTWEASNAKEEWLEELDERISFIESFPAVNEAPLSTDASACPTDGFLRSSLNQNNLSTPPSAGDGEPVAWRIRPKGSAVWSYFTITDSRAKNDPAYDAQPLYAHPTPAEGLREALERLTADVRDGDYRRVLIAKDNDLVWCTATWKDVETVRAALSPTKATGAES